MAKRQPLRKQQRLGSDDPAGTRMETAVLTRISSVPHVFQGRLP